MTYTDFANSVLLALYRETDGDVSARVDLNKLLEKYGIVVEKEFWLGNLQNEWSVNGQAQFIDTGIFDPKVAIEINGIRVAESLPASLVPQVSEIKAAEEVDEAVALASLEVPNFQLSSVNWTGLSTKVSEAQLSEIKSKIVVLNDAILQSDADAQMKLNAIKRVEAVQILLEAPDVPWREVVELLNSPSMTAFLTVLNIIQFIIGLAQ